MKTYRVWIFPHKVEDNSLVIDMKSPNDEIAAEFARRATKLHKGKAFVLQKRICWFIYKTIKKERVLA